MNECNLKIESNELEILVRQLQKEVDTLSKTTEATLLKHDGKIAELCLYIKENLSNELRTLLDTMVSTGELNEIIDSVISNDMELLKNKLV